MWKIIALIHRLVGLVVRRPPRERKIPGSNPACAGIFSGSSHTSDLKIGTPVATLPGAWRYRVSTGTGRPGVSILWLGEVERWICNFYLSVAARTLSKQIRPWDTLACCWDVKQPTNKQTNALIHEAKQSQIIAINLLASRNTGSPACMTFVMVFLACFMSHLHAECILKEKSNLLGSIFPFNFFFNKPNDMYNRTT